MSHGAVPVTASPLPELAVPTQSGRIPLGNGCRRAVVRMAEAGDAFAPPKSSFPAVNVCLEAQCSPPRMRLGRPLSLANSVVQAVVVAHARFSAWLHEVPRKLLH